MADLGGRRTPQQNRGGRGGRKLRRAVGVHVAFTDQRESVRKGAILASLLLARSAEHGRLAEIGHHVDRAFLSQGLQNPP